MSQGNEKEIEAIQEQQEENVTSLDLLWKQSLQELDAWCEQASFREEALLSSTKQLTENIKRNQENVRELVDQFNKEQRNWEQVAREELLSSTTSLQYLFPIRSYEEINRLINKSYDKLGEYTSFPIRTVTNAENLDKFVDSVERYVEFRKKSRMQFVDNLKKTLHLIHESQSSMYNLFTKQVKNVLFPFNKYIERSSELTKS